MKYSTNVLFHNTKRIWNFAINFKLIMRKRYFKRVLAIVGVFTFAMSVNAQAIFTKKMPVAGATYDSYIQLNDGIVMPAPQEGNGVVWDYASVTSGAQMSFALNGVYKSPSQLTVADKDSFPTAVYVEERHGGVAPYESFQRLYFEDEGDYVVKLGTWMQIGTNPESTTVLKDTVFKFGLTYQSTFTSSGLGIFYTYTYAGSGTLKIRDKVYNNVIMCRAEWTNMQPEVSAVYHFFSNDPFFVDLAQLYLMTDGTGNFLAYKEITYAPTSSVIDENQSNFSIYPNPANNQVIISNLPTSATISIVDLTGITVYSTATNQSELQVSTNNLINGVYFVKVESNGNVTTEKLMINR